MTTESIKRAITPLRLIFWGGLLCIFDVSISQTVNGEGFKFDFLNDALGAILIAVGVFRLAALPVPGRYAAAMTFAGVVSILEIVDAIREHFIQPWPDVVYVLAPLLSLAALAAIMVFCLAMRRFCLKAAMPSEARSWKVTTVLFVVIYVVPLGPFYMAALVAMATNTSFNIDLGPAGLLLMPVFAIPLIHLFVSTSRMKRAAEQRTLAEGQADVVPTSAPQEWPEPPADADSGQSP